MWVTVFSNTFDNLSHDHPVSPRLAICHWRHEADVSQGPRAFASLADNLLAHERLEGEQVEEIVREWLV